MSQKSLTAITLCVTAILIIWMLWGSLCEIRMSFWGAKFAAFLQCKQQETATGEQSPVIRLRRRSKRTHSDMNATKNP
jgi:protein HokA